MITVDNQLKLLISLYEEEKVQLQKLIDECLAETEYLMAHYYSQALYKLNRRLQILHNIDDNLYDQKEYRRKIIDSLQKKSESENSGYIKEYYESNLQRAKQELEELNQFQGQAAITGNETLLDESLKKLADKKIKHLKLILKKSDNLFFVLSYSGKMLKVTMPYVKIHTKRWILYEDNISSFINLGFDLSENGCKLILNISGDKEEILRKVKIIMSKIVFEIFNIKEFDNESYIELIKKSKP